jgi:hypothetical protein
MVEGDSGKHMRRAIGILQDSRLPEIVQTSIGNRFPVRRIEATNLNGGEQSLDAIVLSLDDIRRMPRIFETPIILVGEEPQRHLAPQYAVSEFVPFERGMRPSSSAMAEEDISFNPALLEQTIEQLRTKVDYVRTAQDIFGTEFQVDFTTVQNTIQEGRANSLFDAYHLSCQEFLKELSDRVRSASDRPRANELRNKIAGFAWETKNMHLLDDLFANSEDIGVANAVNKLIEFGFGKDIFKHAPAFLPSLLGFLASELKDAPVGYITHEHSHAVLHVPGTNLYVKYAQGKHKNSTRHEAQVLERIHKYAKRVEDSTGKKFLSIPEVMYTPTKAVAERIDYDVLVLRELPGVRLSDYLFNQHRRLKQIPADRTDERKALAKDIERVEDEVLDDVARFTALSYVIARLEDAPDLVRQTFSGKKDDHKKKLELRFFGDPAGDEDFRGVAGGARLTLPDESGREIGLCQETILHNIDPVLDIIVNMQPGIDTDRSTQNILVETGEKVKVHQLDFETFRNDPLLQSWVQTALLLHNYNNGKKTLEQDFVYGADEKVLFKKGEAVDWHAWSPLEFYKKFHYNVGVIRRAITPWKANARNIRVALPSPAQAARDFYALSAYRSGFYFGYFERFRGLRRNELPMMDYMQDLVIENGRKAIEELRKLGQSEAKESSLRLLHDSYQQLHDVHSTRGDVHGH